MDNVEDILIELVDKWMKFVHYGAEGDGVAAIEEAKQSLDDWYAEHGGSHE